MPLFKQEWTITLYAEAEKAMDLTFGTDVAQYDQVLLEEEGVKIRFYRESISVAQEVTEEEFKADHETNQKHFKCT